MSNTTEVDTGYLRRIHRRIRDCLSHLSEVSCHDGDSGDHTLYEGCMHLNDTADLVKRVAYPSRQKSKEKKTSNTATATFLNGGNHQLNIERLEGSTKSLSSALDCLYKLNDEWEDSSDVYRCVAEVEREIKDALREIFKVLSDEKEKENV